MTGLSLLLIGHGSRDADGVAQFQTFAHEASCFLDTPVVPCFLELADPSIATALEAEVTRGACHIVALPLFLGPAAHQKNDVPTTLNWARQRWPDVRLDYGTPLNVHPFVVEVLADRAQEAISRLRAPIPTEETALVLLGRGSRDPDANSNVAKLARLLWEGRGYGWVEPAFYSLTGPGIEKSVYRCVRLGARRVVVVPHFLFGGVILTRTAERLVALDRQLDAEVVLADHMGSHPRLFELLRQRLEEAVGGTATMNCDLCKYRHRITGFEHEHGLPQSSDHHHGLRGLMRSFDPGRAAAMGAAPLQYTPNGDPDWANTWQSFCELALHGGPPHRGALLEPVAPHEAVANLERYERVVAEIERGLVAVTGLPTVKSNVAGWVGLLCDDETMALWLLQAILVENVFVRREGTILFFPAAPHFTLENEIKNVVTCAAKSVHYWQQHMMATPGAHNLIRPETVPVEPSS